MDIVKRLRLRPEREMLYIDGCVAAGYGPTIEAQAADEIERLRADLDAALELLQSLRSVVAEDYRHHIDAALSEWNK